MNIYIKDIDVYSDKIKKEDNIFLIADLHGRFDSNITRIMEKFNPHHIVIAGDIMQGSSYDKLSSLKKLRRFLTDLKSVAPTIITLGNHDLYKLNSDRFDEFADLRSIDNIYPLYNSDVILDNYHISNFTPRKKAFDYKIRGSAMSSKIFLEDFNKLTPKVLNDNHIEELITHSPVNLFNPDINNALIEYDYILCGHLHNGYIPIKLSDKLADKIYDKGIWEMPIIKKDDSYQINPLIYKKNILTRGAIYGIKNNYILSLNHKYYHVYFGTYSEISERDAFAYINKRNLPPVIITGGINKFAFYPFHDGEEITNIKIKRKIY